MVAKDRLIAVLLAAAALLLQVSAVSALAGSGEEPPSTPTPTPDAPVPVEEMQTPPEASSPDATPTPVVGATGDGYSPEDVGKQPFSLKLKNFVSAVRGLTRYELRDGRLKFRLGASFMLDATTGNGSDEFEHFYGDVESRADFRFGVVYASGQILKFYFSAGIDLGADPGIDEAWIEGSEGGLEVWGHYLGKLRIGIIGEPFSLERRQSFYDTSFLERSLPVAAIAPGYNAGAKVYGSSTSGRSSWSAGIFSFGQSNEKNASNSLLSFTGRFTYLPVYRENGRRLMHIGIAASTRSPTGSDVRYRARPEARFVDFLADTGSFSADNIVLLGLEAAVVNGPLWVSAEYIQSDVKAQLVGDPTFHGGYVQVGWFITGENRPYDTGSGTFGRVRPDHSGGSPFRKGRGGAWEVALRYSQIDLTDGLIEGGELDDFSVALNWYVNGTTRVKANYIHATPQNRGSANIFLLRVQYHPW